MQFSRVVVEDDSIRKSQTNKLEGQKHAKMALEMNEYALANNSQIYSNIMCVHIIIRKMGYVRKFLFESKLSL